MDSEYFLGINTSQNLFSKWANCLTDISCPFWNDWVDMTKFMQVAWGKISMFDAEKRLLANALQDIDNQHFVLLSDRRAVY